MNFPGFSELRRTMCRTCEGVGEIPRDTSRVTCRVCNGTGRRN